MSEVYSEEESSSLIRRGSRGAADLRLACPPLSSFCGILFSSACDLTYLRGTARRGSAHRARVSEC